MILLLAAALSQGDPMPLLLERWRHGSEEERFGALREAARLRPKSGDAALAPFAASPVPSDWPRRAGDVLDLLVRENLSAWWDLAVPLLAHPDAEIRARAAEELGRPALVRFAPRLVPVLKDGDLKVKWYAALALLQMEARDQVPAIAALLKDPQASVRLNVLHVIGRLGVPAHGVLVAPYLQDADPDVAISAVQALGELRAVAFADRVAPFLDDAEPTRRQTAIASLARMGARTHVDSIARRLQDDQFLVRWEAVRALGKLKASEHAAGVVDMLRDDGAEAPVLEALAEFGRRDLAPHIVPYLDDVEPGIRWRAVRAMGRVDAKDDAPKVAVLLEDVDSFVRLTALQALGSLGASGQAGAMVALLRDEESTVAQAVAEECAVLATPSQLKEARALFRDPDPMVRGAAIELLAAAGDRGALEDLPVEKGIAAGPARAILRLGGTADHERLLAALGTDGDAATCLVRTVLRIRLGKADGAERRAAVDEVLRLRGEPEGRFIAADLAEALLAARSPEAAARWARDVQAPRRVDTSAAAESLLGVPLEGREPSRRLPAGSKLPAARAARWLFGEASVPGPDGVRLLTPDEALAAWKKTLDAR